MRELPVYNARRSGGRHRALRTGGVKPIMGSKISRRELLVGAAGASCVPLTAVPAQTVARADTGARANAAAAADSGGIIPPLGRSFMKFSYDFPEPSVEFGGLRISFRLHTFENTYGLDRESMKVVATADGIEVTCSQLVCAGGQVKAPGRVRARIRKNGGHVEWNAMAEMEQPIKSLVTIVRGVPRGKISAGGIGFFEPHDDEVLLGYPFGGGSLFLERGMARMLNTPLAVIQSDDNEYFYLSARCDSVRANRFYFQPGENGYRVEMVY